MLEALSASQEVLTERHSPINVVYEPLYDNKKHPFCIAASSLLFPLFPIPQFRIKIFSASQNRCTSYTYHILNKKSHWTGFTRFIPFDWRRMKNAQYLVRIHSLVRIPRDTLLWEWSAPIDITLCQGIFFGRPVHCLWLICITWFIA